MKTAIKNISLVVGTAVMSALFALPALAPESVSAMPLDQLATDTAQQVQRGINQAGGGGAQNNDLPGLIRDIVNILLFIVGIAAVIMIVVGGLRYVLSGGDSNSTKAAKDTVLYAIVGLVVAIMAYAIVNFVVGRF